MVTNPRTLRAMAKQGFIEWQDGRERHWTGLMAKRRWVHAGPKLDAWYQTFTYRGNEYRLRYLDGCFHPFVFKVGARVPDFI